MDVKHRVINCRFARPTLFLSNPHWFAATDCPWSCLRKGSPRALETTEECLNCPNWQEHPEHESAQLTA